MKLIFGLTCMAISSLVMFVFAPVLNIYWLIKSNQEMVVTNQTRGVSIRIGCNFCCIRLYISPQISYKVAADSNGYCLASNQPKFTTERHPLETADLSLHISP